LSVVAQSEQFGMGEKGYESLKEYARDNLPEFYEELENATEENLEEVYWKIYLNKIGAVDPLVAQALGHLYEHDFDIACLNDDTTHRNIFLSKLAELRLQAMEAS
jgi:hypothetical protein